jgi:hypothetical protein
VIFTDNVDEEIYFGFLAELDPDGCGMTSVNCGVTRAPCGTDVGTAVGGGFDVVPPPPPPPQAASARMAASERILRIWTFAPCEAGCVISVSFS